MKNLWFYIFISSLLIAIGFIVCQLWTLEKLEEASLTNYLEIFESIAVILASVGTVAAAFVAYKGFSEWRVRLEYVSKREALDAIKNGVDSYIGAVNKWYNENLNSAVTMEDYEFEMSCSEYLKHLEEFRKVYLRFEYEFPKDKYEQLNPDDFDTHLHQIELAITELNRSLRGESLSNKEVLTLLKSLNEQLNSFTDDVRKSFYQLWNDTNGQS